MLIQNTSTCIKSTKSLVNTTSSIGFKFTLKGVQSQSVKILRPKKNQVWFPWFFLLIFSYVQENEWLKKGTIYDRKWADLIGFIKGIKLSYRAIVLFHFSCRLFRSMALSRLRQPLINHIPLIRARLLSSSVPCTTFSRYFLFFLSSCNFASNFGDFFHCNSFFLSYLCMSSAILFYWVLIFEILFYDFENWGSYFEGT